MGLWCEAALVEGEWRNGIRIDHKDGLIVRLEAADPAPQDERAGIALPGLGNVHSHAFQRGMAGLAERRDGDPEVDDSFWNWRQVMYGFLDRLGPDDVEAIAAMAYVEMLESGFTRVGEFHYLHHAPDGGAYDDPAEMAGRIAAAAEATGIHLTLLPVFYAHGGFGAAPPAAGQRRFVNTLDGFAGLHAAARRSISHLDGAVVGVAPHSLRAATPQQICLLTSIARDAPVHIHIAEQALEVADCLSMHGSRPIDWLMDQVDVDGRWCLVHATHVSAAEIDRIVRAGAVVGLCPITEANLGDGLFPAEDFLSQGGRMALGSDSNVLIDAAEEFRTLEYGRRLATRKRNVLSCAARPSIGGRLYRDAHSGAAQALGVSRAGLAVGQPLDLVSLNGDHPSLIGRGGDALLDGWIFAGRGGAVDAVWSGGCKVVSDGRHLGRDAVVSRYRQCLAGLLSQ